MLSLMITEDICINRYYCLGLDTVKTQDAEIKQFSHQKKYLKC